MTDAIALPRYITTALEEQQQRMQVAQLGLQDMLNVAADYVAEQTGLTRRQVIEQYRYDQTTFSFVPTPKQAPPVPDKEQ